MRGKQAKRIRKHIYTTRNFRDRKYTTLSTGTIIADPLRRAYQLAKKGHKLGYEYVLPSLGG